MSRSNKPEKGARGKLGSKVIPKLKDAPEVLESILSRHMFGQTEKILRRNRKVWTRLTNKRRRNIDKKTINESG